MEQKKEAVYLINDERYLHLRENGAGVGFATYNKVTGEPLESGQISEKNLPPDGRNAISAARNWYLFELLDDDRKVIQQESVKILENIPQAGIGRRRIWEPETLPKDVRLINSHYDKPMQPVSSTMWLSMTFLPLMPTWSRFKIDWHGCPIAKGSIKLLFPKKSKASKSLPTLPHSRLRKAKAALPH